MRPVIVVDASSPPVALSAIAEILSAKTLHLSTPLQEKITPLSQYADYLINLLQSFRGRRELLPLAQRALEKTGLPITGSSAQTLRLCLHPGEMLKTLQVAGIPVLTKHIELQSKQTMYDQQDQRPTPYLNGEAKKHNAIVGSLRLAIVQTGQELLLLPHPHRAHPALQRLWPNFLSRMQIFLGAVFSVLHVSSYAEAELHFDSYWRPYLVSFIANPSVDHDSSFALCAQSANISYPDLIRLLFSSDTVTRNIPPQL